jgi:hypothetical protein
MLRLMSTDVKTTRNLWPIAIIALCSLFFLGTVGLVVMACSQKVDLVSADYYEKELKFQAQIDRADHTRREASQTTVAYDTAQRQIVVSLPPGQVLGNVWGSIELYRPSASEMDRTVKLEPDAHGVQHVDASRLAPGLWKVRVTWTAEKQNYYLEQKVVVGAKAS